MMKLWVTQNSEASVFRSSEHQLGVSSNVKSDRELTFAATKII
jgi:hypothetical protein